MDRPIVINLFAGPGAGKSTTAAGVFSLLKMHNINAELVTEFSKDLTWEKRDTALRNQYYVWAKQHHRMFRVKDQVDVMITDSPLLLSLLYGNGHISSHFYPLVTTTFKEFDNICYFIERVKPYNPKGRNQTEEEAKRIDANTKRLLDVNDIDYEEVPGNLDGVNHIVTKVLQKKFNIKQASIYMTSRPSSEILTQDTVNE